MDELVKREPVSWTGGLVTAEVTGWASQLAHALEAAADGSAWDISHLPLPDGVDHLVGWPELAESLRADARERHSDYVVSGLAAFSSPEQREAAQWAAVLMAAVLRQLPRPAG